MLNEKWRLADLIMSIINSIKTVLDEIAISAKKSGRRADEVKLIAVSKTYPVDAILEAYDTGQRLFGENRIQELSEKVITAPDDIEWHLIGHLQSNKVAKAVELASYIHSIDTLKLLARTDRLAGELGRRPKILLELNISGEESKFGSTRDEAFDLAEAAVKCANIDFRGLMTMAPSGASESELRKIFSGLRNLKEDIEVEFNISLPELSMGMSSDFKIAIEEGATFVRVGTSIFGNRN